MRVRIPSAHVNKAERPEDQPIVDRWLQPGDDGIAAESDEIKKRTGRGHPRKDKT